MSTVQEILTERLKAMGADGLAHEECGCGLDDLAPCGNCCLECVPARRLTWKEAKAMGYDDAGLDLSDNDQYFVELDDERNPSLPTGIGGEEG